MYCLLLGQYCWLSYCSISHWFKYFQMWQICSNTIIISFCSFCRTISISNKISASAGRLCVKCWTSPWRVSVPPKGTCALGNSRSRCSSSDHICLARCFGELYDSCSISLLASRSSSHWQRHPKVWTVVSLYMIIHFIFSDASGEAELLK